MLSRKAVTTVQVIVIAVVVIVAAIAGGVAWYATRPAPSPPLEAEISVSPTLGHVEDTATITGTGFEAGVTVSIEYDGTRVKTVTADSDGNFQTSLSIPESIAGSHVFTTDPVSTAVTFEVTKWKVAAILPSRIDDMAFNYWGYMALMEAREELGVDVAYTEAVSVPDAVPSLRDYANRGYDLIYARGCQFQEAALSVAKDFPNTYFLVGSAWETDVNVADLNYKIEEVSYLVGMLAGSLTKTNKIGIIAEYPIPMLIATNAGFVAGIEAVNPDAEIIEKWTMAWEDATLAREATLAAIDEGADVICHSTGGGSIFGVMSACKDRNVLVNGSCGDQSGWIPNLCYVSFIMDDYPCIKEALEDIRAGTFKNTPSTEGGGYWVTTANGGLYLRYSDIAKESIVSEELRNIVEEAAEKIVAGEIIVPTE